MENEKLAQDFKIYYNIVKIYWTWTPNLMYGFGGVWLLWQYFIDETNIDLIQSQSSN